MSIEKVDICKSKDTANTERDADMFENIISESFRNSDIADGNVNDVAEITDFDISTFQTEIDFENLLKVNKITKDGIIEPTFYTDDINKLLVFNHNSEIDLTELPVSQNSTPNENFVARDCKLETTQKSIQEFDDILRCYGTKIEKTTEFTKEKCKSFILNDVPIELEETIDNNSPCSGNITKQNVCKDEPIILVDSDLNCAMNDTNEISTKNYQYCSNKNGLPDNFINTPEGGQEEVRNVHVDMPPELYYKAQEDVHNDDLPIILCGSDADCAVNYDVDTKETPNDFTKKPIVATKAKANNIIKDKPTNENISMMLDTDGIIDPSFYTDDLPKLPVFNLELEVDLIKLSVGENSTSKENFGARDCKVETQKSFQELEDTLRYYGTIIEKTTVFTKEKCKSYIFNDVPIELEEGVYSKSLCLYNITKQNVRKDEPIILADSDFDCAMNNTNEILPKKYNCVNNNYLPENLINTPEGDKEKVYNVQVDMPPKEAQDVHNDDLTIVLGDSDSDCTVNYDINTKETPNDFIKKPIATETKANNIVKDKPSNNLDNGNSPIMLDTDSECDGYHSSDFEFITESEAHLVGLTTGSKKCNQKKTKLKLSPKARTVTREKSSNINDAVSGPSRNDATHAHNNNSKYWSRSYNGRLRVEQHYKDSEKGRTNHEIPQGAAYLNLFQGFHATTATFSENKSVISAPCMTLRLGYEASDMIRMIRDEDSVSIQLLKEAKETAKRILQSYPEENKKKRRRL